MFYLIVLHNFKNVTEFWNFGKEKKKGRIPFVFSNTASVFVKKAVEKKRQTQVELPNKTMNSTRIALHIDHLKARFAQEVIFFFRTGLSCA